MEWRPRRNHPCQILCQSVKEFLGGSAPKMAISYTFLNDPYNIIEWEGQIIQMSLTNANELGEPLFFNSHCSPVSSTSKWSGALKIAQMRMQSKPCMTLSSQFQLYTDMTCISYFL